MVAHVQAFFIAATAMLTADRYDMQSETRRDWTFYSYIVLGLLSVSLWLLNLGHILGGDPLEYYNNYTNKFLTHQRAILWTVIATRAVASVRASGHFQSELVHRAALIRSQSPF